MPAVTSTECCAMNNDKHVCGICYHDLTEYTVDGENFLSCSRYRDEHRGAGQILRSSADYARRKAVEDLPVVIEGLRKGGMLKRRRLGLTADEIISQLY